MTLFGCEIKWRRHGLHAIKSQPRPATACTLADLSPGRQARVTGFLPGLSNERRAHLQAYGLVPGYPVKVLRHSPVTIIQVEHIELALERELAGGVEVKEL